MQVSAIIKPELDKSVIVLNSDDQGPLHGWRYYVVLGVVMVSFYFVAELTVRLLFWIRWKTTGKTLLE